jgi:hypothetical protein
MEGKVIAVWVHSNLDKVELFLNGQSLSIKQMEKNGHLAWNVAYMPGIIEAHRYKDDKLVLSALCARPLVPQPPFPLPPTARKLQPTEKTSPWLPLSFAMRKAASFPSTMVVADNPR